MILCLVPVRDQLYNRILHIQCEKEILGGGWGGGGGGERERERGGDSGRGGGGGREREREISSVCVQSGTVL